MEIIQADFKDFEFTKKFMLDALASDSFAFTSNKSEFEFASEAWWNSYIGTYLSGINAKLFFAKLDDKVVGMIVVSFETRQRLRHVAHIYWLFVNADARGKGCGSALLDKVLEEIKLTTRIKKIHLGVTATQVNVIEMYKRRGFVEVGVQKDELEIEGKFVDLITMEKYLHQSNG